MVQFTIAYVALGFGVLLIIVGVLSIRHARPTAPTGMLSSMQRVLLLGGLGGMLAFIAASFIWHR